IKKKDEEFTLSLKKTQDILASLGKIKSDKQLLVGFALETNNEQENALKKLKDKNADMIILNSLNDKGAGFGHDTNKVRFYFKNGMQQDVELKTKKALAKDIVDSIIRLV
ncbi:MAG: phosphopantothenoylcysteine decarboxylase domain-containing protein, partial [Flavisolibacter sp.]